MTVSKKYASILVAIVWLASCLVVAVSGLLQHPETADIAVILGNEVYKNGEASERLQARLNAGIGVYKHHLAPLLLVSGGTGKSGYDEATVMAAYLRQHGIPDSDIIVDSQGSNTRATAVNTVRIMQERHLHSAIAVSQYFHVPRCLLAFRQEGIAQVSAAYPVYFEVLDIVGTTREVIGLAAYFLRLR